ncbi:MAG: neuraminidase-like domain-containing protein [Synechococcus sp.]
MHLSGQNLEFGMPIEEFEDVQILHNELQHLGYQLHQDPEAGVFGEATYDTVMDFQRSRGLPPTGIVDEATAHAINLAVDALAPQEYTVTGRVFHKDGTSLIGLIVRAFDRDLRREELLGEAVTEPEEGNYTIHYTADKFTRAEKKRADLIVRAFSPEGKQLAVSETRFNAGELEERVDLEVVPQEEQSLSEYERLLKAIAPLLEDVALADLTDEDIQFLAQELVSREELRDLAQKIQYLREAAQLAQEIELPMEALYAWGLAGVEPLTLQSLSQTLPELLRQKLQESIDATSIPKLDEATTDAILAQLKTLYLAAHPPIDHQVTFRLLQPADNEEAEPNPLVGFILQVQRLEPNGEWTDLGWSICDGEGKCTFPYTTPHGEDPTPRPFHLAIFMPDDDRREHAFATVDREVPPGLDVVIDQNIEVPEPEEPPSERIEEVVKLNDWEPAEGSNLAAHLNANNLATIADIRRAGSLPREDDWSEADTAMAEILESHANLSILPSPVGLNQELINSGFHNIMEIADTPQAEFVDRVTSEVPDEGKPELTAQMTQVHATAVRQKLYLDNLLTAYAAERANGFDTTFSHKMKEILETHDGTLPFDDCKCPDCKSAVSPLAYLADLLDYTLKKVKNDSNPLTFKDLKEKFHQPFGELPVACEEMDKKVRQVRLCIEVLRRHREAQKSKPDYIKNAEVEKALLAAEADYRLEAFQALLTQLGASYDELRLLRTQDGEALETFANRFGIDPRRDRIEKLTKLARNPNRPIEGITEIKLEQLFGLQETAVNRDVLSDGAVNDDRNLLKRWNLKGVVWNRHTDADGKMYLRLETEAKQCKLYRDERRADADMIASWLRNDDDGQQVTLHFYSENDDDFLVSLTVQKPLIQDDKIEIFAIPQILSWRLQRLRTLWQQMDWPEDDFSDRFLFEIANDPAEVQTITTDLNQGKVKSLRDTFAESLVPLSEEVTVVTRQANQEWLITDDETRVTYRIQKTGDTLVIHRQRQLPVIDSDIIGPDDFRWPFRKPNADDADQPFDLWRRRREWVDSRITFFASQTVQITPLPGVDIPRIVDGSFLPDLEAMFWLMSDSHTVAYPPDDPIEKAAWPNQVQNNFKQWLNNLDRGTEVETTAKNIQTQLHLSVESFRRLMALWDKDQKWQQANPPNAQTDNAASGIQRVTEEEWQEVYSILVQALKGMLRETWIQEEQQQAISLDNQVFWPSQRLPLEGAWPPILPATLPIIDPDSQTLDDLAQPTIGIQVKLLWESRQQTLIKLARDLKQDAGVSFEHLFENFTNRRIRVDNFDDRSKAWQRNLKDQDLREQAASELWNLFCITPEDFTQLMTVKAKADGDRTKQDINQVCEILYKSIKFRDIYQEWKKQQDAISIDTPIIDPDELNLKDLAEHMAGETAIDLWHQRQQELQKKFDDFEQQYQRDGLDKLFTDTLGVSIKQRKTLNDDLNNGGQAKQEAERTIKNQLHLTVEDFNRLMYVDAKAQPTEKDLEQVFSILLKSTKYQTLYPQWVQEQKGLKGYDLNLMSVNGINALPAEGESLVVVAKIADSYHARIFNGTGSIVIDKGNGEFSPDARLVLELEVALNRQSIDSPTKSKLIQKIASSLGYTHLKLTYWQTLKARLPKWRAPMESRQAWQQALKVRSQPPAIDPDMLTTNEYFQPSHSGEKAKNIWDTREKWIVGQLQALQEIQRAFNDNTLSSFDILLVFSFFGEERLSFVQNLLTKQREHQGCQAVMGQVLGDFAEKLETLQVSLNNARTAPEARRIIRGSLYVNLDDFGTLLAIRDNANNGQPVSDAKWQRFDAILTTAKLVKSIMSLEKQRAEGEDISTRLKQLGLTHTAFAYLVRCRQLIVEAELGTTPLQETEWEAIVSILTQVLKQLHFSKWREKEQRRGIILSPDAFQLDVPEPGQPYKPIRSDLPEWRANRLDHLDWRNKLEVRLEQQTSTITAFAEAISSAEEVILPPLRDALIEASDAQGTDLSEKAKALTDRLLIDTQAGGCQKTTRISQAIETLQNLLWSIRTGQLYDTYKELSLTELDDFDEEWKWIGSYTTWRSAMFVFLYPENILIPSLRKHQTPAFRQLVSNLRKNRQLTPEQARQEAKAYEDYLRDICSLKVRATCYAESPAYEENRQSKSLRGRSTFLYLIAQGSKRAYWSAHKLEIENRKDKSEIKATNEVSFWHEIKPVSDVMSLVLTDFVVIQCEATYGHS